MMNNMQNEESFEYALDVKHEGNYYRVFVKLGELTIAEREDGSIYLSYEPLVYEDMIDLKNKKVVEISEVENKEIIYKKVEEETKKLLEKIVEKMMEDVLGETDAD